MKPIANAMEVDNSKELFLMSIGPYGTGAYVWADHLEDAFEEFVEWLDDEGMKGFFSDITEADLKSSAEDLGIAWEDSWPDYEDNEFTKVVEHAEEGLTTLGWTTFKHGQYLNEEWYGHEVTDRAEFLEVYKASSREYFKQYGEVPRHYGRKTSKRRG